MKAEGYRDRIPSTHPFPLASSAELEILGMSDENEWKKRP